MTLNSWFFLSFDCGKSGMVFGWRSCSSDVELGVDGELL